MQKGKSNGNYKLGWADSSQKHLHKLRNSYNNMKQRCMNTNHPKYHRYGGRGITIAPEWLDPKNFFNWAMRNGWMIGLTIDRIDNDGNYSPENCQWISHEKNSRKKSTTKLSMDNANKIRERLDNGESAYDLADQYGVVHGTIWFIQNNFTHVEEGECAKALKRR